MQHLLSSSMNMNMNMNTYSLVRSQDYLAGDSEDGDSQDVKKMALNSTATLKLNLLTRSLIDFEESIIAHQIYFIF